MLVSQIWASVRSEIPVKGISGEEFQREGTVRRMAEGSGMLEGQLGDCCEQGRVVSSKGGEERLRMREER